MQHRIFSRSFWMLLSLTLLMATQTYGQVGIGHRTPDDTTMLDINGKLGIRDVERVVIDTSDQPPGFSPLMINPNGLTDTPPLQGAGGLVQSFTFDPDQITEPVTYIWNPETGTWEIGPAAGFTLETPPGSGIIIDRTGTVVTISLQDCAEEEILMFINGQWSCFEIDTSLLNKTDCPDGHILQFDASIGPNGEWVCVSIDDALDEIVCTQGQVLVYDEQQGWICGNSSLEDIVCADGEVLVYNSALPGWECGVAAPDLQGDFPITYTPPANPGDPGTIGIADPANPDEPGIIVWNPDAPGGGQWEISEFQEFGWLLSGNNATDESIIGTLNNFPFRVFTNNNERMRVTENGNVVVNSTTAASDDWFSSYATDSRAITGYASGGDGVGVYAKTLDNQATGIVVESESTGILVTAGGQDNSGTLTGIEVENLGEGSGTAAIKAVASYDGTQLNYGVYGESLGKLETSSGVYGVGELNGVYGVSQPSDPNVESVGVDGVAFTIEGVAHGVRGRTFSSTDGATGVLGEARADVGGTIGVQGISNSQGQASTGVRGFIFGPGNNANRYYAVAGVAQKTGGDQVAVYGEAPSNSGFAGYFSGDVLVTGRIQATNFKTFRIDHPLDPQNKYLVHACIESDEPMNIYSGTITTDAEGRAVITMPDYVQAVNTNFRYNLTCIGQFAQAIISKKIQGNQFEIRTDKPNVEVSWTVYAQRNDPYAQQHPFVVEEDKAPQHKGKYLQPELYNKPQSQAIFPRLEPDTKPFERTPSQIEMIRQKANTTISHRNNQSPTPAPKR